MQKKGLWIIGFLLLAILGILVWIVYLLKKMEYNFVSQDTDLIREMANKLKIEHLNEEAILEYLRYLDKQKNIKKEVMANIYYIIGDLYMKQGKYKKALAYFYRSQTVLPESKISAEMNPKMVECLERLGRSMEAMDLVDQKTSLTPIANDSTSIVAMIGKEKITMGMLNRAIDTEIKYQPWLKERFKTSKDKLAYLKEMITEELLYRKGLRMGIDKSPEIRQQLNWLKKKIIAQNLLESELSKIGNITEDQLRLYYKANKARYIQRESVKIAHILLDSRQKALDVKREIVSGKISFEEAAKKYSLDKSTKDKGGIIDIKFEKGIAPSGFDVSMEFLNVIFSTKVGELAGPVKTDKGYHIIKVIDKTPFIQYTFQQVKDKVAHDMIMEKRAKLYENLLRKLMKENKVRIYEDVFNQN